MISFTSEKNVENNLIYSCDMDDSRILIKRCFKLIEDIIANQGIKSFAIINAIHSLIQHSIGKIVYNGQE